MSKHPNSRLGWFTYYSKRNTEQAVHLATWYYLLHEAFGEN